MTKTQVIQSLIDQNGFKSYLEIGLGDGVNFRNVQCSKKLGCDPAFKSDDLIFGVTSDNFFLTINEFEFSPKYDLIFIDGLHHATQLAKDVINAWKCLNQGGMILIHDIKPHDEAMQIVPRQSKQWTGDVWRVWSALKNTKLNLEYIEETYGIGMIKKSRHKLESIDIDYSTSFKDYFLSRGWQINI